MATKINKKSIRVQKLINDYKILNDNFECVIVEGSGGLLVPVNGNSLTVDLVKQLNIPVIVVIDNKLGCINHALLTLEALKRRRMQVMGIIYTNAVNRKRGPIQIDNPHIISKFTTITNFGELTFANSDKTLKKNFNRIGLKIINVLK